MPAVKRYCVGCQTQLVGYYERKRGRCWPCEQKAHAHPWKKDR